jgi:hypothetical protein
VVDLMSDYNPIVKTSRPLATPVHVYDDPQGRKWRGGVVWSIDGDNITVRVRAEAAFNVDYIINVSLFPSAPAIGSPVVCRVEGSTPDDYQIAEIRGGVHPRSIFDDFPIVQTEAGLVDADVFMPSALNGIVAGVSIFQDGRD